MTPLIQDAVSEFGMASMESVYHNHPIRFHVPNDGKIRETTAPRTDANVHPSDDTLEDSMEPIAIVGMSAKLPQSATSPEAFWKLLEEGRSAMTEVPSDRFNIDAFYHPNGDRLNTLNVRGGHFLQSDLAEFDAPFFSIPKTEAESLDPQQRGLLESTYHALENAGISLQEAAASKTGVFVGCFAKEYDTIFSRDTDMQPKYQASGTGSAMLSNRLSWFYDLRGPSITLDTACSSSLNALHLACQSIRAKESTMAIVAGCNVILNPDTIMMSLSNLQFLSPDSLCYSFDHRANGYSRGEGFGVIVLKPLSQALSNNDTIRAVIRASSSNQDGRTPGITQPSRDAQARLIQETYEKAGLGLGTTMFFEAHGTGTQIGDTTEASAIHSVFGKYRSPEEPLIVGAVKSNVGHLEGASGLASIIKTVLALEKGVIPPNTNFEKPNPRIPVDEWNIKLTGIQFPTKNTPWPSKGLRRASVNSFGYGGSNAHVILDDAYHYLKVRGLQGRHRTTKPRDPRTQSTRSLIRHWLEYPQPKLLVWSASDEQGPQRHVKALEAHLSEHKGADCAYIADLAYTLASKRSRLPWKSFLKLDSSALSSTDLWRQCSKPIRSSGNVPGLGFVFTGQGATWYGMGRELLAERIFQESLQESDSYLRQLCSKWSLIEELQQDETYSRVKDARYSQPLTTAIQIALLRLLESWNIRPLAVVGHSSGEIAAAYCIGAISHRHAIAAAYYRGTLSAELAAALADTPETMMAVALPPEEINEYIHLAQQYGPICISCVNSPKNVTVSGSVVAIEAMRSTLEAEGVFARRLDVKVAYHSPTMQRLALDYLELLQCLDADEVKAHKDTNTVMFSSVTGKLISRKDVRHAEYWVENMVSKVEFSSALSTMRKQIPAIDYIVELGPTGALRRPVLETLGNVLYESALKVDRPAYETILDLLGDLWSRGVPVDLMAVNGLNDSNAQMLTDLPSYPFNHSHKYWYESRISKNFRFRKYPTHELLGTQAMDWNPLEAKWRHIIDAKETPWIKDHGFNGSQIYPAAGMIIMAIEAARQVTKNNERTITGFRVKDVSFVKALVLSEKDDAIETHFYMRPREAARDTFGEREQGYASAYIDTREWQTKVSDVASKTQSHLIHPTALDAVFHLTVTAISRGGWKPIPTMVPTYLQDLWISSKLLHNTDMSSLQICSESMSNGLRDADFNMTVVDDRSGELVISASQYRATAISSVDMIAPGVSSWRRLCFKPDWKMDIATADKDAVSRYCNSAADSVDVHSQTSVDDAELVCIYFMRQILEARCTLQVYQPHLQKYVDWIRHYLHEDCAQDVLNCEKMQQMLKDQSYAASVITKLESSGPEGKVYVTIGRMLSAVLEDEVDVLELLFGGGLLQQFYSGKTFTANYERMRAYVDLMAHKDPNMSVLEIGAGTGGATAAVIQALGPLDPSDQHSTPRFREYSYTDISAGFFEEAKVRFKDHASRLAFKTLNIEKEPRAQGFEEAKYDLIVASCVLHATADIQQTLQHTQSLLKPGGKLLLFEPCQLSCARLSFVFGLLPGWWLSKEHHRHWGPLLRDEQWDESLRNCGFSGYFCISLLELESTCLWQVGNAEYTSLKHLIKNYRYILWITGDPIQDPRKGVSTGFARSMCSENDTLDFISLALRNLSRTEDVIANILKVVQSSIRSPDGRCEQEYREEDNMLHINRIVESNHINNVIYKQAVPQKSELCPFGADRNRPLTLSTASPGLLSALQFVDSPFKSELDADEIEVTVKAVGINFKNVMVALGQIPDTSLGQECSGVVTAVGDAVPSSEFCVGDRVCCLTRDAFRNFARAHRSAVSKIPDEMTFATAAAVPVAFCTAYYSLVHLGRLQSGESILIHAAAGDIVLNSLSGEFLKASMDCVAPLGRFIEIGKKDMYLRSQMSMSPFLQSISFLAVDLGVIADKAKPLMKEILNRSMGYFTEQKTRMQPPQPLTVFSGSQIEEAFRSLQSGRNSGKAVIEFNPEDMVPIVPNSRPGWSFASNATYVIAGGSGGLGRSMTRYMVTHGAKHILLLSRSGSNSPQVAELVQELQQGGVTVVTPSCDVSDAHALETVIHNLRDQMPPIKGCIQGSMVLRDGLFENMSHGNFHAALRPKVQGTWNLHNVLPSKMDFFVLLSSTGGVFGSRGQSNYAAGSTYQDAFAQYRVSLGEKCISLDLGLMLAVGFAAERQHITNSLRTVGYEGIHEIEFHAMLDHFCNPNLPLQDPTDTQIVTGVATPASLASRGLGEIFWMSKPIFQGLRQMDRQFSISTTVREEGANYRVQIEQAASQQDAGHIIALALVKKLSAALNMPVADIEVEKPVYAYGVDSLVAVEIRYWFLKEFKAQIAVFEIIRSESIEKLCGLVAGKTQYLQSWKRDGDGDGED
ncbi:polyketide synthase [Pyrenophora seminiperda CCB06]|uniref:Polyketide synthase n=1 Tax=Pyrenophora seminiperda CCB06 TaxID=1302712 RepID=A0A3M7LY04_9PLEO|nr:polyketide synthase [Pyrenophora seminiperda CCB06]